MCISFSVSEVKVMSSNLSWFMLQLLCLRFVETHSSLALTILLRGKRAAESSGGRGEEKAAAVQHRAKGVHGESVRP